MPAALTPRLSLTIYGIVVALVVFAECFGVAQELFWPVYLSGQVQLLVPRLVSLTWELLYIYWVLARSSQLTGEWGTATVYRHGTVFRWFTRAWLSELPRIVGLVAGSIVVAVAIREIVPSPVRALSQEDYVSLAISGSVLAVAQLQFDFVWCVALIVMVRRSHTASIVLVAAVVLGGLRVALITPMQNFGILLSYNVIPTTLILSGASCLIMLGIRLTEEWMRREKASN